MKSKALLFGKTLDELTALVLQLGLPKFTAGQIADWLYKKEIASIDEMTNLSKKAVPCFPNRVNWALCHRLRFKPVPMEHANTCLPPTAGNLLKQL
jgi:23S rRNA (adenine2503-C2)-methyltransferase